MPAATAVGGTERKQMKNLVDLHVHSTKSDGTFTPAELVRKAIATGLSAFALTDHDTTDGLTEAMHAAQGTPLEVIPGIEFSTERGGRDIHLLGYYFDYQAPGFQVEVRKFADARVLRNRRMCEKLQAAGVDVPYEKLVEEFGDAVITRAQFAKYMLRHGITHSMSEAFQRYIGDNCPCFVPRSKISPEDAVRFILKYHGVPVLAHPLQYHLGKEALEELVSALKDVGLIGLECIYSTNTPAETSEMQQLAGKYGLIVTGGSDFHGTNKPGLELGTGFGGKLRIPESVLTDLKHRFFGTGDSTRIFFADLDGTLLDSSKQISPLTMQVLEDWTEAGNFLVLQSGRALSNVRAVCAQLGLDRLQHVFCGGCNGAEMCSCDTGAVLFREGLPLDVVRRVMGLAAECGVYCQTYSGESIVVPKAAPETDYYRRFIKMPVIESADVTEKLTSEPGKCIAIATEDTQRLETLRKRLNSEMGQYVAAFYSNENYLEIVSVYAGKGLALRRLCRMLGIPAENSLAAGDSENDVSMIRAAGTGIAMCNGVAKMPALAAAADLVTETDNDHDGLAPVLRNVLTALDK